MTEQSMETIKSIKRNNNFDKNENKKDIFLFQGHVHEQNKYTNFKGYMQTMPRSPPLDGNFGVYALDCEMVNNYFIPFLLFYLISVSDTVNVVIFAELNFRASSPLRHVRAVKFSRICCFISICSIVIVIFTHIIFSRI